MSTPIFYFPKIHFKLIFICFFLIGLITIPCFSQEEENEPEDTEEKNSQDGKKGNDAGKWSNLPYWMDDIVIVAGLNRSGIYFSDNFRDLSYGNGFQFGVEGSIPMGKISFFHYGIHYSKRSFTHLEQVDFNTNHLDFPIFASFTLPALRSIDWRFLLGTQVSLRVGASQSGTYPPLPELQFVFNPNEFKNFDGGMYFGMSGEKNDFYFRLRSYVGVNNLDRRDQGAMNTFNVDIGYFFFRKYRQ